VVFVRGLFLFGIFFAWINTVNAQDLMSDKSYMKNCKKLIFEQDPGKDPKDVDMLCSDPYLKGKPNESSDDEIRRKRLIKETDIQKAKVIQGWAKSGEIEIVNCKPEFKNELGKMKTSEVFNSRRMLALNTISSWASERTTKEKDAKAFALDINSTQYPATKATDESSAVTDKLKKSANDLLKYLETNKPNKAGKENIKYLKEVYLPNLEKVEYWVPEGCGLSGGNPIGQSPLFKHGSK
jgi:hypothetical protein